jgi:hypothetical protein
MNTKQTRAQTNRAYPGVTNKAGDATEARWPERTTNETKRTDTFTDSIDTSASGFVDSGHDESAIAPRRNIMHVDRNAETLLVRDSMLSISLFDVSVWERAKHVTNRIRDVHTLPGIIEQ